MVAEHTVSGQGRIGEAPLVIAWGSEALIEIVRGCSEQKKSRGIVPE